jgi:predicted metal-dependent phosphotriesterase family hydrolase
MSRYGSLNNIVLMPPMNHHGLPSPSPSQRPRRGLARRDFLRGSAIAATSFSLHFAGRYTGWAGSADLGRIITVLGPIPPEDLGVTLPHEHVLVDFVGADKISPDRYDPKDAFAQILPHLRDLKALGCRSLVECTPAYLGRNPRLLKRLSEASGLHLLTNTGYYGASDNKFLPAQAHRETAEQLADRWLKEWQEGIEGTKIRPGFIKIGVGGQTLSDLHRNLVRAAAKTHLGSGLAIASHTGPANLALEQLAILREEGVSGAAFVWVHAQAEQDVEAAIRVGRKGCWVSYDGFDTQETMRYVELLSRFRKEDRLDQVLLSHDAGWYRPGEPKGGQFRAFDALFRTLVPALKQAGFGQNQIDQVLILNPARVFAVQVKRDRA